VNLWQLGVTTWNASRQKTSAPFCPSWKKWRLASKKRSQRQLDGYSDNVCRLSPGHTMWLTTFDNLPWMTKHAKGQDRGKMQPVMWVLTGSQCYICTSATREENGMYICKYEKILFSGITYICTYICTYVCTQILGTYLLQQGLWTYGKITILANLQFLKKLQLQRLCWMKLDSAFYGHGLFCIATAKAYCKCYSAAFYMINERRIGLSAVEKYSNLLNAFI
jgi:hypothetical protein